MKRKSFLAKALFMLFAVLFSFTSARAQQALPYEYGFEDNDLTADGWVLQGATSSKTCIETETNAAHSGTHGFVFYYSEQNAYLLSPVLTGCENGVNVSFYYGEYSDQYGNEQFQVGYTTDENVTDASQFTYGEVITASTTWQQYENSFPAGTVRIAIKYIYNDTFYFYLDDFSFTNPNAVVIAKPTGLKVSYEGGTEATVSWSSDASAFDIDVNNVVTENVSNPYTLTGLSLATTYTIKVRAKEGSDVSSWTDPVSFTTEFPALSLPYEDGFEDGLAAWTLVDCNSGTGIATAAHAGSNGFAFKYSTTPPQYLISPEFDGASAMTVSFWYRVQSASYPETFQVGYSTTTKDVDAFTWGEEVTATNNAEWLQYEANFPAGTKFVAVRYNSNDMYYLYLDDFSFTVNNGVAKPTGLKVSEVGANSALLSWVENGEATTWGICLNGDEANLVIAESNPFTLKELTPETTYTAKVCAIVGEDKSNWSNEVTFTTDVQFPAPQDLAVTPAAKTAEVTWTGNAESYNLRYAETQEVTWKQVGSDETATATLQTYTYDLSGYTGTGYIAIRHYNVSDMFMLNVDDITVTNAAGEQVLFEDFESASIPASWQNLDMDGDGNVWGLRQNSDDSAGNPAGNGSYCVTSASWTQADGALNPDNWLVIGDVELGGTLTFVARGQDPNYAGEVFAVMVGQGAPEEWTTVSNVTSPYTIEGLTPETDYKVQVQAVYSEGKSEWAATTFTTLEDVPTPSALDVAEVTWGSAQLSWTENGEATAWEISLNDDNPIAVDSNPFTVTGLTPETEYTAKVRAINGEKRSHWSDEVTFTTDIRFHAPADLAVANITTTSAEISWTADAETTGAVLEYADATGAPMEFTEYKYDNGTNASSIGLGGGAFQWGVMFPAGSYTGTTLTKVSVFDVAEMTGSVTIYNDGATAPANPVASAPVTLTGAGAFIDIAIDATIDATKNVWVIFSNESGAAYPAATANDDLGDVNGRWVELDGTWYDMANVGVTGQCFMVRAEIGSADLSSLTWTTVADATSPAELTGLTPETTYAVRVKSVFAEGESRWTSTLFTTQSENPVPYDIAADLTADGATLTWNGLGESYNVQYRTAESANAIFEDNFANGLGQWTLVTAGEGDGWVITQYGVTSYSWNGSAINADNWLITPAVELGGTLTFGVTTASQYPDSYEVLLSTTGNEIADFTETLQAMATATSGQVSIDLSAYAGQTGYIAIHHVSTDCYLLAIYDFGIYEAVPAGEWQNMAVTEKTATISGLATNNLYEYQIQSVKGENTSDWSDAEEFALLTLADDADNNGLINKFDGKFAHVTLANRTLYKDGNWNTIFLPFDMTLEEVAASPLADADVRTLTNNITVEGETVTLNFTAEGEALTTWGSNQFYGGVPYIVKWAASTSDIVNPEFANVTITKQQYYVGDENTVVFEGTYAPIAIDDEYKNVLFIGEGNKLYWPLAGATIGAFRGYFYLEGMEAEIASGAVKIYTNLDDEDPTGIANISNAKDSGDWYDISGRKLAGKPSVKGIYVNGGRKVTVK